MLIGKLAQSLSYDNYFLTYYVKMESKADNTSRKRLIAAKFSLIFIFSLIFSSCATPPPLKIAPCIRESAKNLLVRWGDIAEDKSVSGFQFRTTGELEEFAQTSPESEIKVVKKWGAVPAEKYCAVLTQTRATFLKVQALHAPGKISRFVEMRDINDQNLPAPAVWNPEYQNKGSIQFRALLDSFEMLRMEAK